MPHQLAAYLASFDLVAAYLPTTNTTFTDNLKRYCRGEVIVRPSNPNGTAHVTDHLLEPVLRFASRIPPVEPLVLPGVEARRIADRFWQSAVLPGKGVLAVHPGSGGRHELWPLEGWQRVLAWAVKEGVPGVLICGPAEEELGIGPLSNALGSSWMVL